MPINHHAMSVSACRYGFLFAVFQNIRHLERLSGAKLTNAVVVLNSIV